MKIPFKVRVACQVTLEWARKNIGIFLLTAGAFCIGFATKDMDDAQSRRLAYESSKQQQDDAYAVCNARIIQNDKQYQAQMVERDRLLADQTGRIAEQTQLLKTQQDLIQQIAGHQQENSKVNQEAFKAITKAAKAAKTAANQAAIGASEARAEATVAAKGVTDKDRTQINKVVKEKQK